MKTLTLILIAISLVACGTPAVHEKAAYVDNGDTKESVIKKMGPPENRQLKGGQEAWQYCTTTFGQYNFTLIWIEGGLVSGVNTYTRPGRPFTGCNAAFDMIKWEEAPTITVEQRNR